jgi:hypothetical protein
VRVYCRERERFRQTVRSGQEKTPGQSRDGFPFQILKSVVVVRPEIVVGGVDVSGTMFLQEHIVVTKWARQLCDDT